MDEAQQIVVDALERSGIVLPPGIALVQDFGPASLISVCSQALGLIHGQEYKHEIYMPGSVPRSVSVRFRACTQLAEQIKQLGYRQDLSFHQFLYPNEADVHQLLRFLLDKLSNASLAPARGRRRRRGAEQRTKQSSGSCPSDGETSSKGNQEKQQLVVRLEEQLKEIQAEIIQIEEERRKTGDITDFSEARMPQVMEEQDAFYVVKSGPLVTEEEFLLVQEAIHVVKSGPAAMEKLALMFKESKDMLDYAQIEREQANIREFETEYAVNDQEFAALFTKLDTRKDELVKLTSELEKSPKQVSRSSYIRRITELVKNSKKQDADVTKIIIETRDLQRDNNATQERLLRIHLLVDEHLFRDAKKDPECRLAYRLLSNMHENFAELADKVFEMDKLDREISELEVSLESLQKDPVNVEKVQADLNAILLENASLSRRS